MYDCEGYGGEFVFVYYELPKLEPLEYTGIEPREVRLLNCLAALDWGFPVGGFFYAHKKAAQAFLLSGPLKSQKTKC